MSQPHTPEPSEHGATGDGGAQGLDVPKRVPRRAADPTQQHLPAQPPHSARLHRVPPRRVTVVSASIGAGHDGAARELVRRLRKFGLAVDCHDFLDLLPPGWGRILRASYELELRVAPWAWGWLLESLQRHRWSSALVSALAGCAAARRTRAVIGPDTGAVVSTYPLASQALGRLRRRGRLAAPVVTFLTDMSVHPLWVARGVDLHLALHPVAAVQARDHRAVGVLVCGPMVGPEFRPAASEDEQLCERVRFGLPTGRPVVLVVAGSWGVGEVELAAREIAATGLATPVTVCGRNEALRERLVREGVGVALGWVDDMPALLRASDVVVQNAGGLTSLEAMASGVPVVSYRCLPGHGVTNAAALDEAGLAPWIRTPEQLAPLLRAALGSAPAAPSETAVPADQVVAALAGAVLTAPAAPAAHATHAARTTPAAPASRRAETREMAS
ncbi:glycosyltransferase [Kitasatospora sp. GP82]|uniref:MGDG synthase family glycosyltransferase n=1 Tax=Kitasatospora sp. GP82 TaxID=3035089 RepID=UPI0024758AF6|nr:glycosyltransferase [Kitasatospora sp. GP82]MDH6129542.1 UDP-N-acetylglucosamine:LPS N-acetylglucosamine transferase [Kitasatospora sp. GP82]